MQIVCTYATRQAALVSQTDCRVKRTTFSLIPPRPSTAPMTFRSQPYLVLAAVVAGVSLLAGGTMFFLQQRDQLDPARAELTVAATIFPLADIVQNVGGDRVQVVLVIPPGVTEHSRALTPQQLHDLQRARVLFQIGQGLDTALVSRVTRTLPHLPVVTVDRGITLRDFGETHQDEEEEEEDHAAGSVDPHYWLTVPNAQTMARSIAAELTLLDPAHAAAYEHNLADYLAHLAALEDELQRTAARAEQKHFIAMHDAWSYLAPHYGFELVATYEPVEGRQPSVADLAALQELVREFDLTTFFVEPQKRSSAAVRFVTRDLGLVVGVLDPVGGAAPLDSYAALMRENVRALVEGG